MPRVRDRDGEPVAPEDVLDPEELADYYNRRGWPTTTEWLCFPPPGPAGEYAELFERYWPEQRRDEEAS